MKMRLYYSNMKPIAIYTRSPKRSILIGPHWKLVGVPKEISVGTQVYKLRFASQQSTVITDTANIVVRTTL
jgi:hypothetical protein